MNSARRKQLQALLDSIGPIRAELETIQSEEQDYYDAMPENMQEGEKGQKAEAAADALSEAVSALEEAESSIEAAME